MKKGLDYYTLPCIEDERIELVEAELGIEGFAVIVKLLCKIYGQNGYYCQWDPDCAMLFARKNCISRDFVNKVVDVAIKRGFFSRRMYERYSILTSAEIQQFFMNVAKRRKEASIDSRFICAEDDTCPVTGFDPICYKEEEAAKAEVITAGDIADDTDTDIREEAFEGITEPEEPYIEAVALGGDEVDVIVYPDQGDHSGGGEGEDGGAGVAIKAGASAAGEEKKPFGRYGNVLLTDTERAELGKLIRDADDYIDRFSQKLHDRGYRYADHYEALIGWWKRDSELPEKCGGISSSGAVIRGSSLASFDTDEFFAAAVKKSMARKGEGV